ncbi:hypothetical protein D3C80_1791400 [compost metagenome]
MTTSAPKDTGAIASGENVLSTTSFKLCFLANAAIPAISVISIRGLLTVSQYSTLVCGVIAFSTTSSLVLSTKVVRIFSLGRKFFMKA